MIRERWGLDNCTMERGGQTAPAESDCLRHPMGHGIIHLIDQAGGKAVHSPGTVRPREVAFQSLGTKHDGIIEGGLLLRGQSHRDGNVCHGR